MTMSISDFTSFWYASNPTKWWSGRTVTRGSSSPPGLPPSSPSAPHRAPPVIPACRPMNLGRAGASASLPDGPRKHPPSPPVRRSPCRSAGPTTAWVPRPPQPINPAFSFSLPAPRTSSGLITVNAAAPNTVRLETVFFMMRASYPLALPDSIHLFTAWVAAPYQLPGTVGNRRPQDRRRYQTRERCPAAYPAAPDNARVPFHPGFRLMG